MSLLRLAVTAALVLSLVFLVACKGADDDEKRTTNPKPSARAPSRQSAPDGDEDDENHAEVNAVAAESSAPLQAAGQQLVYNFDSDSTGQLPQKFHSTLTGTGGDSRWTVMADPSPRLSRTSSPRRQPIRLTTGFPCLLQIRDLFGTWT